METTSEKDIVSLFPYQIKRRDNFYQRDHPKGLNPAHPKFDLYWDDFIKKCIEGIWIDDEGTWVYMYPKLFFYVNYPYIADAERNDIHPDLRDNEWILSTYYLCGEGFSGFEEDEDYTCHYLIQKYEKNPDSLDFVERKKIPESTKKKDGKYKKYIDPWYYLTRHYLIDHPTSKPLGHALYENPRWNLEVLSSRDIGKALHPDELVRVKNGWKKIKDIEVGDKVYGGNGRLTNVTNVFKDQKNLNFYKITLRDGREISVCEDHLWKVWDKNQSGTGKPKEGEYIVKSTKELLENYRTERVDSKHKSKYGIIKKVFEYRYALPLSEAIKSDVSKNLPIHPYVLGCLLGDGGMTQDRITLSSEDKDLLDRFESLLPSGYKLTKNKHGNCDYGLSIVNRDTPRFNHLLKPLGLSNKSSDEKFIPKKYLFSSYNDRLELLKGLMDTDGSSFNNYTIEFSTCSEQLHNDFLELVRSLGIGAKSSIGTSGYKNKDGVFKPCKTRYRVHLFTSTEVFTLERKLQYLKYTKKKRGLSTENKTFITNIQPVGKSDGVCITVDNEDSTYITKDYIVTHNTFYTFVGEFLHEWVTGGVKRFEDKDKMNKRLLFAMGAANAGQLNKSLLNVKATYDKMPGKYIYPEGKDKKKKQPYMGPFYKNVQGNWQTGGEIKHIIKKKNQSVDTQGSSLQMFAITMDKLNIAAGDRFRRVYVEEVGLLKNCIAFYGSVKDSLKTGGIRVGSLFLLGTGGNIETIREPKEMFENPQGYDIFGIPNYWKNPNKKIALFISKLYGMIDYKDDQGNTMLELAYKALMKNRAYLLETSDSLTYDNDIMNNPVNPDEMLRPGSGSVLPKQEAQQQLNNIEQFELFRKYAQIGTLTFDPLEKCGVRWEKDMTMKLRPIVDIKIDDTDMGGDLKKDGAVIIYEQPPEFIPYGLYWVLYDPCKTSGDGQSYHSVLVYKYFYSGGEDSLEDTVVAEWIGRRDPLNSNFEEVIKIAKYFNARIFPENNVPGFIEWCESNKYFSMLYADSYRAEQEQRGDKAAKVRLNRMGYNIQGNKKTWLLTKLRDWLLEVKRTDVVTGIPIARTINTIYSKRIMNEIIQHTGKKEDNFDHISSLLGLVLLRMNLLIEMSNRIDLNAPDEEDFDSKLIGQIDYTNHRDNVQDRCAFLQY